MFSRKFQELFKFVHSSITRKWIPDLGYRVVSPGGRGGEFFDPARFGELRAKNHCLKIGESYVVFSLNNRPLSSIERAFIDWTVDKVLEYAPQNLDYPLRQALRETLPRQLISVCLSFPDYDLSYAWKHLHGKIAYFGPTRAHYGLARRERFNKEELKLGNVIYDLLVSVEDLSDSTNEGASFASTIAFINGDAGRSGPEWAQASRLQFIKALSGDNTAFVINKEGRLVDYLDISLANLDDQFAGAMGNSADVSSGQGDDAILDYIFNFQIEHPDQDIFFISSKENGDIFIYKNRSVLFFRRGKVWHFLNYKAISDIVRHYTGRLGHHYGDAINLTIIDMLLEHSGCCLGLVPREAWLNRFEAAIGIGQVDDFLSGNPSIKRCFWANSRVIRKRLLSIDGAVLLSMEEGEIYNVGAIIPNPGASSQGARTTATKAIAAMGGIGIKISDDGYCEIYEPGGGEAPSFVIGK